MRFFLASCILISRVLSLSTCDRSKGDILPIISALHRGKCRVCVCVFFVSPISKCLHFSTFDRSKGDMRSTTSSALQKAKMLWFFFFAVSLFSLITNNLILKLGSSFQISLLQGRHVAALFVATTTGKLEIMLSLFQRHPVSQREFRRILWG